MNRNTLLIDAAIAVILAIVAIVVAPGLAVVGLLAILVLLVCAVSFAVDRRRKRRSTASRPRRRAPARDGPHRR